MSKKCCVVRVISDKVKWCVFNIHIFFDFLPILEYSMRNRTEQNRTEQCDALRASVKHYFENFYPLRSEWISQSVVTLLDKSWMAQYLSSTYSKEEM